MKTDYLLLPAVAILSLAFASCSLEKENPVSKIDIKNIALTDCQVEMIKSNNAFAFSLFNKMKECVSVKQNKNVIFSPFSISAALSMTLNGAKGQTLEDMKKALQLSNLTVDEINTAYYKLTNDLLKADSKITISIANSVWTLKGFPVKKSFIERLGKYYNAETHEFTVSQESLNAINQWIEDETDGMIKNMLEEISGSMKVLLINAIYFNGEWASGFKPENTGKEMFFTATGNNEVDMMKQTETFKIYHGGNFDLLELPYGRGNFVMDIILPRNNKEFKPVLDSFTEENYNTWIDQLYSEKVNVWLPKFKYSFEKDMKDILQDLGMGIAFSDMADFSDMANGLCIDFVKHNAAIELNEKGTKAAAATVVGMKLTSIGPSTPYVFKADHPFIYTIREVSTNTVLFIGEAIDPESF